MITAYASANTIIDVNTLFDADIAQSALTTTQNLFGTASDSENGGATFSFSWTLVDAPSGHGAALVDSTIQNPTLNSIDTWGNYRFFLIATNTSTSATSETDPILAPNSAFVTVRVNSTNRGLEKPAKGERDWHTKAHEWVSAIENTELNHLTNVSLGTLSSGEFLKYDGTNWVNGAGGGGGGTLDIQDEYAIETTSVNLSNEDLMFKSSDSNLEFTMGTDSLDPTKKFVDVSLASSVTIGGNLSLEGATLSINSDNTAGDASLKFYKGGIEIPEIMYDESDSTFKLKRDNAGGLEVIMTQDDVPTTTVRGGVLLSGATNTTGKILDVERLIYTQGADQSVEGKASGQATVHDAIRCVDGTDALAESQSNHAHVLFQNKTGSTITITTITIVLLDSGTFTTDDYNFALVTYSSTANMVSNTTTTVDALGAITRTANKKTGYIESTGSLTVATGAYFGIKCTQECDGHFGHGLRVTIEATRSI